MSAGVLQVFSMEAVAEKYRGIANSGYQAAFLVPWALMAPVGGLIIAHLGYPAVFIGGALCYLLASTTLWVKFGRGRENRFGNVGASDDGGIVYPAAESSHVEISSNEMLRS